MNDLQRVRENEAALRVVRVNLQRRADDWKRYAEGCDEDEKSHSTEEWKAAARITADVYRQAEAAARQALANL